MSSMYVKPSDGVLVRMPDQNMQPVPAEGAHVPKTPYYINSVRVGDLVKTKPPKPAASETSEKPATSSGKTDGDK